MVKKTTLDTFLMQQQIKKEEELPKEKEERPSVLKIADEKIRALLNVAKKDREVSNANDVLLLSVEYDADHNKALMKFYDPKNKKILFLYDRMGHKPYCLTSASREEILQAAKKMRGTLEGIEEVEKYDPIEDKNIKLLKVIVSDPLAIGGKDGVRNILGEDRCWEAWIQYHLNYIYDAKLWPSMIYDIVDKKPVLKRRSSPIENELLSIFQEDKALQKLAQKYLPIFSAEIPNIDFVSVDIEVAGGGRIPQMSRPYDPIIAIGLTQISYEGPNRLETREVFVLRKYRGARNQNLEGIEIIGKEKYYTLGKLNVNGKEIIVRIYDDEKLMLLDLFEKIWEAPIVVTFNGDTFDLRYIFKRCEHLGIPREVIPFKIVSKGEIKEAHMHIGVHIDLYKFYGNAAIKTYAFANRYETVSLEDVSQALLGVGKIFPEYEEVEKLSLYDLARYCWWDSYLTAQLFDFQKQLPLKLMIMLSRITRYPIRELSRRGVSAWIENWFYAEHRDRNYLIPNRQQLENKENRISRLGPRPPPIISGKKYRGAIVLEPKPGVWFNVWVLDFASIYPTIIKVHNISYETVDCPHEECMKNRVEELPHWICTKRRGLASELVGFIRDLRVRYFKKMAKKAQGDQKLFYNIIQGALKVLINASYGVFGAEHFPLYALSVAETITAIGRQKIKAVVKKAQEIGLDVLYGDTDSIFIHNPPADKVQALIEYGEKVLNVDLEVDKIYRYLALSARKKNYFGVLQDGSVDIKGLMAKKRNTPEFLKKEFRRVLDVLSAVTNPDELEAAKKKIEEIIIDIIHKIRRGEYSLEDLAFRVQLTKSLSEYTKTTPQHVQAARKLKREVLPGEIIAYVKTKDSVTPIELRPRKSDIDWAKYIEYTRSVFEQLLDALGMSFSEIESKAKGVVDLSRFLQ